MPDLKTLNATKAFRTRVAQQFPMMNSVLLGSRARGQFRPDSDADVAVLLSYLGRGMGAPVSAGLLLEAGDGASNRAYYAMFDTARAVLADLVPEAEVETIRSHNGLITVFSLHLVKTGKVSVDLGRNLNRVEELRLVADYRGDSVDLEQAQ